MEEAILKVIQTINAYLSDYILVIMLLGAGLYFTVRTRFVQFRCFKEGINSLFGGFSLKGSKEEYGMSSFQALATAIAGQVGTGNIIGASGAILTGGPGAIFWMWVIAFFGMATIYAEAVLAQETRRLTLEGDVLGGPVYYIRRAFKGKLGVFLSGFFAFAIIIALGFAGCMVQANSIGATFETAFGIPSWVVGVVLAIICGFTFIGGTKRLASVTEKIVPIMAALFLGGGLIVVILRIKFGPMAIGMIFKYAFVPKAIIGGGVGAALKIAISQGAKRGLFSNEAGMGSTPHAHAQANVKNPHEQGCIAMIGLFIDTFIVLTLTALVVICTLYAPDGPLAHGYVGEVVNTINKTNLAQTAFGTVFTPKGGNAFIAIALFFFAFSTIISWNMFGRINVHYVFGKKAIKVYTIISILCILLGTAVSNNIVWELSDMFNNLMVIPNVLGLFGCSALVIASACGKKKDEAAK